MLSFAEYTYEDKHLSEKEALERYAREKLNNPNGIVTLDQFDCGHVEVNVYNTEKEKQAFYQKRLTKMLNNLLSRFKK